MNQNFSQAPLPFQGQKRRFLSDFKAALCYYTPKTVFVDLFGGSGLLSHTTKQARPDATVIYNDYDDYHLRIEKVEHTNFLLRAIRELVAGVARDKKLTDDKRDEIIKLLSGYDQDKVDYITLSSNLLFSMNYTTTLEGLSKQTMYNVVRKNDYATAEGYLDGVEIVKMDYKDLYRRYRHHPSVVFLVDPPYLSTDCSTYKSDGYWTLTEYLDVLTVLQGTSYFYFTSNKSEILELCQWMESNLGLDSPFRDSTRKDIATKVNHNAGYTDIMLYKRLD
jgi:site-specific DNA-adenine methylase